MEIEERSLRKNNILLVVIGIATLLVAIVSATFAYFSATITKTDENSSIKIQTAALGITYNHGQAVLSEDLMPGGPINSKVVTVENNTAYEVKYTLRWKAGVTNTFVNQPDLTYAVNCEGKDSQSKAKAQLPATNASGTTPILTGVTLPANTTHTCTFDFEYLYKAEEQNADKGKSFVGNFEIIADQLP